MTHLKILKEVNSFLAKNPKNIVFLFDGNIPDGEINFSMQGSFEEMTFAFMVVLQSKPELIPALQKAIKLASEEPSVEILS
jgi:hypothetical protein